MHLFWVSLSFSVSFLVLFAVLLCVALGFIINCVINTYRMTQKPCMTCEPLTTTTVHIIWIGCYALDNCWLLWTLNWLATVINNNVLHTNCTCVVTVATEIGYYGLVTSIAGMFRLADVGRMSSTLVETVSINYEDFNDSFLTCGTCLCVYDGQVRNNVKFVPLTYYRCCLVHLDLNFNEELHLSYYS